MSEEKYVRLNNSLSGYGELYLKDIVKTPSVYQDLLKKYKYMSFFWWPKKDVEEFQKKHHGSMAGYDGRAFNDALIFDFDCEQNLDLARRDISTLFTKFTELGVDPAISCSIDFSGKKGFHIECKLDKDLSYIEIGNICKALISDLETSDVKIYDKNRKFRMRGSKHQDSQLFKIPLTIDEFYSLSIDEIKELAKNPRTIDFTPVAVKTSVFDNIKSSTKSVVIEDSDLDVISTNGINGVNTINFALCPNYVPKCVYGMLQGALITDQGVRNAAYVALCNYLRGQGKNQAQVTAELKNTAKLNYILNPNSKKGKTPDQEIEALVNNAFTSNVIKVNPGVVPIAKDNEVVKNHCIAFGTTHDCKLHRESKLNIVNIGEVSSDFETFAKNFDNNTVKTGINFIDNNMKIVTATTTLLIGSSGAGKTTLALDMMQKSNELGFHTMFFSMDMYKNLVFLKLAQKVTKFNQNEILHFYKTGDTSKIAYIRDVVQQHYNKTVFDFSKTLSLDDMKTRITEAENKIGNKIKLATVDYAGRVSSPYSDAHAGATYNAVKSVEIAEETNAAWVYLAQISRSVGDGSTPLRTKRAAKDSGAWEESATNVITMWRPFLTDNANDNVVRLFLAKNRMGAELESVLHWNGAKGTIMDMTEEELHTYKVMREQDEAKVKKLEFTR